MGRHVGIDLGQKGVHVAAYTDERSGTVRTMKVTHTKEGLDLFLKWATHGCEEQVQFVMEPTGLVWITIGSFLKQRGHIVCCIKPEKTADLRKFVKKHTKSDRIDAQTLSTVPRIDPKGTFPVHLPDGKVDALKRMVKRRERFGRLIEAQKKRIITLMNLAIPNVMEALGKQKFTDSGIAFMKTYCNPGKAVREGLEKFKEFWRKESGSKCDPMRAEKVFQACENAVDLYSGMFPLPFDYKEVKWEIREELNHLLYLERQSRKMGKIIKKIYLELDPYRTLESIVGIAEVIAPAFLGILGNSVERFPNANCVVSYMGCCPGKHQSGGKDPAMPMKKSGNRILKKYLYLTVATARRHDPEFAAFYARLYRRGYHHNRIMTALANKMARRVYAVLKRRDEMLKPVRGKDGSPPDGHEFTRIMYQLRSPDGKPIDKKTANTLIQTNYAREVVAPERAQRDREKRNPREETPDKKKRKRRPVKRVAV